MLRQSPKTLLGISTAQEMMDKQKSVLLIQDHSPKEVGGTYSSTDSQSPSMAHPIMNSQQQNKILLLHTF